MLHKIINVSFVAVLLWSSQIVYSSQSYGQKNVGKVGGLLGSSQDLRHATEELKRKMQAQHDNINSKEEKKDILNTNNNSSNIVCKNDLIKKVHLCNRHSRLKIQGSNDRMEVTVSGDVEKIEVEFEKDSKNNYAKIYLPWNSKAHIFVQPTVEHNEIDLYPSWCHRNVINTGQMSVHVYSPFGPLIASGVCVGAMIFYWMFLKK
jgi:hypothetical protein